MSAILHLGYRVESNNDMYLELGLFGLELVQLALLLGQLDLEGENARQWEETSGDCGS